ncbi:MAG: hypothetical protein L6300_05495 [Syntrophaceae bacterium]|nr:hypothetical protein [bacterium]MCG2739676.1 hypothetical protein [Syntrophaceae bacterium]
MKTLIATTFLILSTFVAITAFAMPSEGFKEGPYLLFGGGIMDVGYDNNIRTNTQVGDDFELAASFIFGWDVLDYLGFELQSRYANAETSSNREHVAGINLNCVYHLILEPLTDIKGWHITPFIKAGPAAHIAMVPGDPDGDERYLLVNGIGGSVAGGIHLMYKYLYTGIEFQGDFLHFSKKSQTINTVTQEVIEGGFDSLFNVFLMMGIHY